MRHAASCCCAAVLLAGLVACGGAPMGDAGVMAPSAAPSSTAPREVVAQAVAPRHAAVPVVSCVLAPAPTASTEDPDAPARLVRAFAEELASPPPVTPGSGVVDVPDPFTPSTTH